MKTEHTDRREIKFRAWDNVNKRMCYFQPGFEWDDEYDLWYLSPTDWKKRVSDVPFGDNINLMQYTGLKDKNVKEIWEGDILRVDEKEGKGEFPYDGTFKARIVKVIWSDFRASWTLWFSDFANNDLFRYTQYGNWVEVIGNIYENPELLKP